MQQRIKYGARMHVWSSRCHQSIFKCGHNLLLHAALISNSNDKRNQYRTSIMLSSFPNDLHGHAHKNGLTVSLWLFIVAPNIVLCICSSSIRLFDLGTTNYRPAWNNIIHRLECSIFQKPKKGWTIRIPDRLLIFLWNAPHNHSLAGVRFANQNMSYGFINFYFCVNIYTMDGHRIVMGKWKPFRWTCHDSHRTQPLSVRISWIKIVNQRMVRWMTFQNVQTFLN